MGKIKWIVLVIGAFAIAGCVEEKDEFTINSDGSGKVIHEVTFQPISLGLGGEKVALDPQVKENVQKILTKSSGIDTWKDISYTVTNDGRTCFRGTAFFPDINRLKIHGLRFEPPFNKEPNGEITIELTTEDQTDCEDEAMEPVTVKFSEAELDNRVKQAKSEYNQYKMIMQSTLSTFKSEMVFHLPGRIKEISNFQKVGDRSVRIVLEGSRVLEIMDEMMANDRWLREEILAGRDPGKDGPRDDIWMNEKLFGEKAPVRVILASGSKDLFNYDSEVSSAKKNYGKMIKELGLEAAIVERDAEVLVSKVRSVSVAENYGKERLRLSMSVKLPRKAVSATDGKIEKAIAGSGKNVLGDASWDKQIDVRSRLKEDGRTCEFKVHLLVPDEREKKLKEITGELEYLTASGTKKIDLGMMDFRAGVKSSKAGFGISKVGPSEWEEGSTTMSLKVDLQRGSLKSVKLYDENGEELDVSQSGTSSSGSRLLNLDFRARGQFPSKGKIVLDVWDNAKKHKVGFKALDISLGRDEPSVDEATGLLIARIADMDFPQMYGKQGNEYKLPLKVKLPNPVLSISEGIVEKVTSAAGKSLLPEWKWARQIHFPKLKRDKTSVEFSILIRNPEKQKEFIKELSGTLEYFTSNGTKTVDTGLVDFKEGTEIEEIGTMIELIKADENQKGWMALTLGLGQLPHQAILSAEFYSSNGQKLNIETRGWGSSGGKYSISFSIKGSWPPNGRIVLQVAKNLKKHKLGFKAVNILLDGNSFESKSADDSKAFLFKNSPSGLSGASSNKELTPAGVPDYTRPLNVQMREARQKELEGDFSEAIQLYQGVIVNTKAVARYIARAYYRIGLCYLEMNQEDKAADYFQRLISEFPEEKDVPRAKRALKNIGD